MKFLSSPIEGPGVTFPGGGGGTHYGIPTYLQETDPALDALPPVTPYIWFRTNSQGKVIDILQGG